MNGTNIPQSKSELFEYYKPYPKHLLRNIINDILIKSRGYEGAKNKHILKPNELNLLKIEMEGTL